MLDDDEDLGVVINSSDGIVDKSVDSSKSVDNNVDKSVDNNFSILVDSSSQNLNYNNINEDSVIGDNMLMSEEDVSLVDKSVNKPVDKINGSVNSVDSGDVFKNLQNNSQSKKNVSEVDEGLGSSRVKNVSGVDGSRESVNHFYNPMLDDDEGLEDDGVVSIVGGLNNSSSVDSSVVNVPAVDNDINNSRSVIDNSDNSKNSDNFKNVNNNNNKIDNNSESGKGSVSVGRMRSDGTFRKGRVVEAGDWNNFTESVDYGGDGLGYTGLDSDVYSGDDVDRDFGVPVDGLAGGVGERYVERAIFEDDKHTLHYEVLDSDFNFSTSSVVDVSSDGGVPVRENKSFIDKYEVVDDARVDGVSDGFVSSRINKNEIRFFKNLGYTKKEFMDAGSLLVAGGVDEDAVDGEVLEKSKRRINRALNGGSGLKAGSRLSFTARDSEILTFLAMFKYANASQLARMFSCSADSVRRNLRRMESSGLVVREKVVNTSSLWFLTDAGMLLSGIDLPRTTRGKVNWAMFPHQFTVNHVAANLWGANLNVLNLDDFPSKNKIDIKGRKVYGEELISELAIQSSFGKFKIGSRADVYKPLLMSKVFSEFDEWKNSGGVSFGSSPEFFDGNEWMWVLLDTGSDLNYHVPDLVVKRERSSDGKPRSIAVEVELMNKDWDSYMRTLIAYQSDTRVYEKVIWVCKNLGTAEKLEKVAKTIGLWQEGRISIMPVLTEDGVFKGDLWTI